MWDLQIRMKLVLTEDFLGAFFERKDLSDKKLKEEIEDWLKQETIECNDCGNRKLPYILKIGTEICENCEQKELLELKDDLEKLDYEMDISEIQRIRDFRISNSVITTTEFMEKYAQIIDLDEKELRIQFYEWMNENTTFCDECGIRWINNRFDEEKTKCKNCEIDELRIKNLKKICNNAKVEIMERELLRLISMIYTNGEILDQEFIEVFQKNKNNLEKNLKQILDKFLNQRAGVKDSKSSGNKSDNEESDGSKEILSPNNDDNNENFEEPQKENDEENIINRPDFDSSERF
ncbi:hypothetical protein C1646_673923 [Rhizophagus diaphanus]|nr:hypothetical protein C1646_673923 [Rhizophagus diaphanus] [Rhizophagus sp. MUCL 43196]